jgi:O-antigen/teichoic acid export membrane protein
MASLSDKAALLILANTLKYAVGFALPMVLVRHLTQDDYGTYQQLSLIANFATGIMVLGLPTSIYYFYHRKSAERPGRPTLIVQTQLMLLASGALTAVAIVLVAPLLARRMSNARLLELLPLYSVYVGLFIAGEHFMHLMISQNRYRGAITLELAETGFRVATLVMLLALGFALHAIVLMLVVYAAVRLVGRSYWLWQGSDSVRHASWSERFLGAQLAYSLPLAATSGIGLLGALLDRGIVAMAFTPVDYAIYSVGALEIPLDTIFQVSVLNVLRASLPPLVAAGRIDEVIQIWRDSVRKLAIIIVPSFTFLVCFANRFITTLFTNAYQASVHVFRIYLLVLPLYMLVLSVVPQVYGRTRLNLYVVAISVASNAVLSLILLREMGILGPATALVCSTYLSSLLFFIVTMRLLKATPPQLLPLAAIGRTALAAVLAVIPAVGVASLIESELVALASGATVFGAAYLLAGYLVGVFNASDISFARSWIRRLVPVVS